MGPRLPPTLPCAETLPAPPVLPAFCDKLESLLPPGPGAVPSSAAQGPPLQPLTPEHKAHPPLVMTSPRPVSLSRSRTPRVRGAHQGLHPGSRSRGPRHPAQGRPRPVHRLLHPGVPGEPVQPSLHQPPSLGPAPTHRCRRERRRVVGRREATGLRGWGEHTGDAPLESLPAHPPQHPLPEHSFFQQSWSRKLDRFSHVRPPTSGSGSGPDLAPAPSFHPIGFGSRVF